MRFVLLALAFLGVGRVTVVAAADPAPAAPPEHATAVAAVESASATKSAPPVVTATPPAASAAASPPPAGKDSAAALSAYEQRLINLGYKPQMRNGEKVYCRREAELGSRIAASQRCGTVSQLATTTRDGKDYLEKTQQSQVNPVGH